MNKKTNKKTAKAAKKTAPKYTRLTVENIGDIISDATANLIHDTKLATEIDETFEVEESEESPGTYFIQYEAKTWRDAAAFNAAIIGQAFAAGYFADPFREVGRRTDRGQRASACFGFRRRCQLHGRQRAGEVIGGRHNESVQRI